MKKSLFMMGVAAMALASCTQNEVLNVADSRAIGFSNAFVNNGTRSVSDPSLTKATLSNFNVYGFVTNGNNSAQIFDGTTVTKSTKEGIDKWEYSPAQYWVKGNTYTFAAIAPASAGNVTDEAVNEGKVTMKVTFTNSDTEQKDLLFAAPAAVSVESDDYNTPVDMTFSHVLSKVKFSFTNSVGEGYSVKVKNVQITNAMTNGTFTVGTSSNTWVASDNNLELNFGNVVADGIDADAIAYNGTSETYSEKLMIPTESSTSYTVKFTAELLQGEDDSQVVIGSYPHEVTISNVELKLGYCYDFTAVLTHTNIVDPDTPLNPIEFTVDEDINGWVTTDEEQELDVPTTQG